MIGALIFLSLSTQVPQAPYPVQVPRQFWGEYNEKLGDCGTARNEHRLRISGTALQFWETLGEIRAILRHPDGSVTILAELASEGQGWTDMFQLILSKDGRRLTIRNSQSAESPATTTVRVRCP